MVARSWPSGLRSVCRARLRTVAGSKERSRLLELQDVSVLSTRSNLTCGLTHGRDFCLGWNTTGGLGDGVEDHGATCRHPGGTEYDCALTPVFAKLPAPALDVEVGSSFVCAALDDGSVHCWGANYHGELGNGTIEHTSLPVRVALPTSGSG